MTFDNMVNDNDITDTYSEKLRKVNLIMDRYNNLCRNYVIAFMIGCMMPRMMKFIGMSTGYEGLDYYAEVHQSFFNSLIHTVFMTVTVYGIMLWVPYLLGYIHGYLFQYPAFFAYLVYYGSFTQLGTALSFLLFCYPIYLASKHYVYTPQTWKKGIMYMVGALIIQEVFGHWVGGDNPSRTEAIPNAIVYAPMYASFHIVHYWQ